MIPKRVQNASFTGYGGNLKSSLYDWDSPSSYTGTVKRRPSSSCQESSSGNDYSTSTTATKQKLQKQQNHHYHSQNLQKHNNKQQQQQQQQLNQKRDTLASNNISPQEIVPGNCQATDERAKDRFRRTPILVQSKRDESPSVLLESPATLLLSSSSSSSSTSSSSISYKLKGKSTRLRIPKSIDLGTSKIAQTTNNLKSVGISKIHSGSIPQLKQFQQSKASTSIPSSTAIATEITVQEVSNRNQTSENSFDPSTQSSLGKNNYVDTKFTEVFRDCPPPIVCDSNSSTITGKFAMSLQPLPPPYRDPPKPPPLPPLNQIPSLNSSKRENTSGEKQQHQQQHHKLGSKLLQSKGLIKSVQERVALKDTSEHTQPVNYNQNVGSHTDNNIHSSYKKTSSVSSSESAGSSSGGGGSGKQKSPYKGRVSDIKNCISRINSRGLFSLTGTVKRNEDNELVENDELQQQKQQQQQNSLNEYILYNPSSNKTTKATETTEDDILAKPEFTSSLFKNIPVRPRKGGIPHLDNYCLFDPSVDFINEKDIKKNDTAAVATNLIKSPLKSEIDSDELIEEIIYEDQPQEKENNYFTIDPDGFENFSSSIIILDGDDIGDGSIVGNSAGGIGGDDSGTGELKMERENKTISTTIGNTGAEDIPFLPKSISDSMPFREKSTNNNHHQQQQQDSSSSMSSLGPRNIITPDCASLVRRKTLLHLTPFSTNSLRSHRSGFYVQKEDLQYRNRTIPIESNYVLFNPGPVPSKSVQYKVRKPRPLSSHSDADSGFLSPCSPDELKFNPAVLVLEQCDSIQGYIEIYTDWANYYLERAKSKKKVTDLSADCRDGLLLADVIEAVTSFKVPDLVKKPKNQQQMFDNVNSCLNVLRAHSVGGLDTITNSDICTGRLKAVLALFFALSRYKQQSKQQRNSTGLAKIETHSQQHQQPLLLHQPPQVKYLPGQQPQQQQQQQQQQQSVQQPTSQSNVAVQIGNEAMVNRQIPVPYSKTNGGTAIPLPATVLVQRRCPPDKVRPLPPTPSHTPSIPGLAKTSGSDLLNNSSRPGSPPVLCNSNHHTQLQSSQKGNINNGLRQPQCKIPTSPYSGQGFGQQHLQQQLQQQQQNGSTTTTTTTTTNTKHSMLDKLKLFNKEKSTSSSSQNSSSSKSQVSKRTSSSSGFSSARSERSDSSLSLNNDGSHNMSQIKPPTTLPSSTAIRNTKDQSAKNLKQSKLLAASQKATSKETLTLKSSGKKEKSPARRENDSGGSQQNSGNSGGPDSKITQITSSKNQKTITNKSDTKIKTSSKLSNSKLDIRSESKQSLIAGAANKPIMTTASTGIPKPMAAIKGTTKTMPTTMLEKKHEITELKSDKNDISNNSNHDIISERNIHHHNHHYQQQQQQQHQHHQDQQRTHIVVNPITTVMDAINSSNNTIPNGGPLMMGGGGGPTGHMSKLLQNPSISMSDSLHSNSTQHSSSGGLHSNSSESSVIYRPSSESGSDAQCSNSRMPPLNNPIPNRKLDFHDPLLVTGSLRGGSNMENTNAVSDHHKFHTVPSKIVGTIFEEEKPVNVMPMRPLLRGYNSHVTLPTRGTRGQHYVNDFCDADIAQGGYCSDGDALRRVPPSRFMDIDNGYMSEGSTGIHGKHFLSVMRARTQLPTTIEERIRSSRGSLDSIGTAPPSIGTGESSKMELNGNPNRSTPSRNGGGGGGGGLGGRDNWTKMPEPMNGHGHQQQQPSSPTSIRKEKSSPSHSRRNVSSSSSTTTSSSKQSSGRTKGVPQSFGYVKRSNGSATGNITTTDQQSILLMGGQQQATGRTAHVSAVPRSGKIKVSGGTQTCTSDLQTKIPPNTQHRSFSLTGPGATQLSQSIRERLSTGSHSLPKPGTDMHVFQHRISNRGSGKILDGSLSDTQTYAEVKPEYSTYAMWLKHSNTASSRLSEGDSLESLQIGSPGLARHGHKLLHRGESSYMQSPRLNRSNSIRSTKSEKMYPSMLTRGPEVEIEPYYCLPVGTLPPGANGNTVTVPWSQPTSPTPPNRGFGGPLSPTHTGPGGGNISGTSSGTGGCHRLTYPKKNDEVHGSAASLLSGGSSLYGSAEERQANEVRRLKRELADARDQVMSLYSQLSTNAHVVAAFEQSLSNMTQRLHQLTATAERKDSELTDLRQTIELLRKQSIQAGLTTAHMQSMGVQTSSSDPIIRAHQQQQQKILNHLQQQHQQQHQQQQQQQQQQHHQQQHQQQHQQHQQQHHQQHQQQITANGGSGMQRHHSSDSMCSLNSISSGCSAQDKKKKKGWLRSSFTKAFSRNAKISKTSRHVSSTSSSLDQNSVCGTITAGNHQVPPIGTANDINATLPPPSPTKSPQKILPIIENAKPVDAIDFDGNPVVEDLKKQLREKDLVLTDIRLEALSSASQLESLKDTVMKMRAEMINLKQNNERLQKLVTSRSLAGSEASLGNAVSPNGSIGESRRYSLVDGGIRPPMELPKSLEEEVEEENIPPAPAPEPPPEQLSPTTHIDLTPPPPAIEAHSPTHLVPPPTVEDVPDPTDGKKISIAVYLGQPESFPKYAEEILESDNYYSSVKLTEDDDNQEGGFEERNIKPFPNPALNEFIIAYTYISGKTTWQNLDYIVRKTFKDYVSRIDPGTNLGLNTDSITSYHLGEAKRGPEMGFPELLPCGYIIGNVKTLYICLQGVGSLAFDSLIPRSIVHRYISLLTEHRRLILCGPSGTGKSYLARKLAEFLVARSGRGNPSEAIATFNVDHKSSKELRQYLGHIAEQASIANGASELPSVIILDNLHHASALGDVFSCLLSAGPVAKLPCIIGTMSQATCNTTNLQLHHNFRWVLTANHMEPVKGFLGRFLRRRLYSLELSTQNTQPELSSVLAWLPTVWQHINRFLENHSSSDVTIGPRLFLSCPLDLKDSQVWFTDVWNYHLAPYLVEAVREGVQLYGRRGGAWNDPSTFIRDTYPWPYGPDSVPPLRQINAEDVGLEAGAPGNSDSQDPLLNMLMRLQEAANYSGNQEQESDCASLDSNITPDSSAGAE